VVGQEHLQGVVPPAVDGNPGHEVLLLGREGEVNGPLLVALQVVVGEEPEAQVLVQGGLGGDPRAVGGPGVVEGRAGGVGQAVSAAGAEGGSSNKQYAMRQRRRRRLVQKAFAVGPEAAQGHAQREGQVVQGGLLRVHRFPGWQGRAGRAVHGLLSPGLSPGPAGGAGLPELDRGLAVGLVLAEGLVQAGHDLVRRLDGEEGQAVDVAGLKMDRWIERCQNRHCDGGINLANNLHWLEGEA